MKKIIISIILSIIIMLGLPYAMVEFLHPKENVKSTQPVTPTAEADVTSV